MTTRSAPRSARRCGFTLIELLVVVGIIGLLIALLLPAVQVARSTARSLQCSNNLKQIGLGLHNYLNTLGSFPTGSTVVRTNRVIEQGISWHVFVLPYLELGPMYDDIDPYKDANGGSWKAQQLNIPVFICPSVKTVDLISGKAGYLQSSNYAGVMGAGHGGSFVDLEDSHCGDYDTDGLLYPRSGVKIRDVRDGTSNTLAVGERLYIIHPWMLGAWWVRDPDEKMCVNSAKNIRLPINADPKAFGYYKFDRSAPEDAPKNLVLNDLMFGSFHPGGAHFVFADGSVHFLADSIDFTIYGDLATRDGGEVNRWRE